MVALWKYKDYLAVSDDFIPVFSEDIDRGDKTRGNWKSFIPHEDMYELLSKFLVALERGSSRDKLSLWLTGAYGTGKTFACFVLKHLLEDDLDDIEDYFSKHKILAPLWPRLRALRTKSRYLVVYLSSSGTITSTRRLFIGMQRAIKSTLEEKGLVNPFSATIMDQIITKITDTSGVFSWENAFCKYRLRYLNQLESPEAAVVRLQQGDISTGEAVAAILEEEGYALIDSPNDMKAWIKEVIQVNGLDGLVFIWDEFTEFFLQNVPVTPLQELAQATADMPFYLFLVTHRALSQFARIDDDTRRKLLDRFHSCTIEMNPVTAYKLIANAIEVSPNRMDNWYAKRDSLWSGVNKAVLHINVMGDRVSREEFSRLVPIHPYTAYYLATISSLYSSSQRTLFQFLKTDEPGSFLWFIANSPSDDWYWLTPDLLWLYFFEDVKLESIDAITDILSHYNSHKAELQNEDELRVFRAMLLLTCLWRQTQGSNQLLKPSLSVFNSMFMGTRLEGKVHEVAGSICNREIMLQVPVKNDIEYIIPRTAIDRTKLKEYEHRTASRLAFDKIVKLDKDTEFGPDLSELLFLQGSAALRHPVQIVSARELKSRRDRFLSYVENPYEIGVLLVVAQNDEDLIDTECLSKDLSEAFEDYCILVTQNPFGARRWQDWIGNRARALYMDEMRDMPAKQYYEVNARKIKDEWLRSISFGRVRAFFRGSQRELSSCKAIGEYLQGIVSSVYPYGPESLDRTATLYSGSYGKAGAEVGLEISRTMQRPYKDVVETLKQQGVWEDAAMRSATNHPIARMKRVVDEFFAANDSVRLEDLWRALQCPPFGLLPSPIGILLFASLLRQYANGYYYSDGTNSLPLNPNKLADIVHDVVKGKKMSEAYTIRKMSEEAEEFCRTVKEAFALSSQQTAYPDEARKNLRTKINASGYPLWASKYYAKREYGADIVRDMEKATASLSGILAYDGDDLSDDRMKEVVSYVNPVWREMRRSFSGDRIEEGMMHFLTSHSEPLASLMKTLKLDTKQIMNRLRSLLNEDVYLWREERVIEKIPELVSTLDLVDALNQWLGTAEQELDQVRNCFTKQWFRTSKLPMLCYMEGQSEELAGLIRYLADVIHDTEESYKYGRADDIRRLKDELTRVFRDPESITRLMIKKFTGQEIGDDSVSELYSELPDLSKKTEDEVRLSIQDLLSQKAKQKKMRELRTLWKLITNSESPVDWSERNRVPIHWILEGDAHHSFLARYMNHRNLSEDDIDKLLSHLNKCRNELSILNDPERVVSKFVQVAAGDHARIVLEIGDIEDLQEYICQSLTDKVSQWPMRLHEVQKCVRNWVKKRYNRNAYPEVVKAIELLSAGEIKRIVKSLASEDVLIGARILSAVERYRGFSKRG